LSLKIIVSPFLFGSGSYQATGYLQCFCYVSTKVFAKLVIAI